MVQTAAVYQCCYQLARLFRINETYDNKTKVENINPYMSKKQNSKKKLLSTDALLTTPKPSVCGQVSHSSQLI
jgi:hypothetical protein